MADLSDFMDLIGTLAQGAQVGGAVVSAAGSYSKSRADKAAYEQQAAVAANNAVLAEAQARDAQLRGQSAEQAAQLRTAQLMGKQRAAMASNGIDLGYGSAAQLLADSELLGDIDVETIRTNAAREAWGYNVNATNERNKAGVLKYRAARESPFMAANTSLLSGVGAVAQSWYKMSDGYKRERG